MNTKDSYQEQVNARMEAVHEAMAHHERHLESTESTSQEAHEAALRRLKEKQGHVSGLLQQLEEAGAHAWEHLRKHIDEAIDDIIEAAKEERRHLHREK